MMTVATFLVACLLVAMVPGPSTAVILRQAVVEGRRSAFAATLGNETGLLLWAVAAAFGITALITASELAYDALRIAGGAVLVVMGVQALRRARRGARAPADGAQAGPAPEGVGAGRRGSGVARSYRLGVITAVANAKAGVFAMAFLPLFVPDGAPALPTLLGLTVVWGLVDIAWYGLLIWVAGRARRLLSRPAAQRVLERVSGVVLVGLGLRLAAEAR